MVPIWRYLKERLFKILSFQSVLLHQPIHITPIALRKLCRLHHIPLHLRQHLNQVALLKFFPGSIKRRVERFILRKRLSAVRRVGHVQQVLLINEVVAGQNNTARSSTFLSSRIFPGQGYSISLCMAAGVIPFISLPSSLL